MEEQKEYEQVLDFWFRDTKPEMWFKKDAEFDREILMRFGELHEEIISDKRKNGKITQMEA